MRIKQLTRKYLSNLFTTKIDNLIDKIKDYDVISFDIYDTLIKRDLPSPVNVFELIEKKYNKKNNSSTVITNFKNIRVHAEKVAREKSNKQEVTLNDIYEEITSIPKPILKELKALEIDIEINCTVKSIELFEVYNWCLKNNKKIIFVSDMYLDEKIIKEILIKNGFSKFEKLYLSSTLLKTKKNGSVFKEVLNDYKKNEVVHIGDHIISDYIKPKKYEINAILINREIHKIKYQKNVLLSNENLLEYQIIKAFQNNRLSKNINDYFQFGYEVFGPLLYGFIKWLEVESKSINSNKIFFLARDGYIMFRAFDMLSNDIKGEYLYLSRKSTRTPILYKIGSLSEILNSIISRKIFNLKYVINNLGLNIEDYEEELLNRNINIDEYFNKEQFFKDNKVYSFLKSIENEIYINSKNAEELLISYFAQFEFEKQENIILVDIGWNGTIQEIITKIYPNLVIKGYYLGVTSTEQENMFGYLFDKYHSITDRNSYKAFIGLIESIFSALEGSTSHYKIDDNKSEIEPVLLEFEYTENEMLENLKFIQSGALKFTKDIMENDFLNDMVIAPHIAFNDLFRIGTRPTLSEVNLLGDLLYQDTNAERLAKKNKLITLFLNPRQLFVEFSQSPWKIGFLKRLFKLPFQYNLIYDFLKRR